MAAASNPAFLPRFGQALPGLVPRALEGLGFVRTLPAAHRLTRPGESPPAVWVVRSGLLLADMVDDAGTDIAVGLLRPGDLAGEAALVRGEGRSPARDPGVRTLTASEVLSIRTPDLLASAARDPEVAAWIRVRLVDRVRRTEALALAIRTRQVRDRVVLVLREVFDASAAPRPVTPPELTQEGIAQLVGSTRESVNRALASLVREGRLVRAGRSYAAPVRPSPADPTPARIARAGGLRLGGPGPRPPA